MHLLIKKRKGDMKNASVHCLYMEMLFCVQKICQDIFMWIFKSDFLKKDKPFSTLFF